jgi:hypothetical protein
MLSKILVDVHKVKSGKIIIQNFDKSASFTSLSFKMLT